MKASFIQLFVIFLICLVDGALAYPKTMKEYQFRAQKVLDHHAKTFNTAYQFAASTADEELSLAAGVQHHETGELMTTENLVPLGSLAKAYTTMAVMRLIEDGKMGFNDTITQHVDEILMRSNGTTMLELFKGDTRILKVTIYQLLHMRAGLGDYDDIGVMAQTMADPAREFTALDYIHMFEKDKFFLCDPGTCERYSSNGFVFLGLALAQQSGAATWEDYDQFSAVPAYLRPQLNHTKFIKSGACSEYNAVGVPRTYQQVSKNAWPGVEVSYMNMNGFGCSNGWTMGNIATSAADAARFFQQYLGTENILKKSTLDSMLNYEVSGQPGFNFTYGVGLLLKGFPLADDGKDHDWFINHIVGHPGIDWGSYSDVAGYNRAYDFSFVIAQNTKPGLSCELQGERFWEGEESQHEMACYLLDLSLQYFSKGQSPRLNCTRAMIEFRQAWRLPAVQGFFDAHNQLRAHNITPKSKVWLETTSSAGPRCYPFCGECFTGVCHDCKECIGHPDKAGCAKCYKVTHDEATHASKACLDAVTHDRCEVCWNQSPLAAASRHSGGRGHSKKSLKQKSASLV